MTDGDEEGEEAMDEDEEEGKSRVSPFEVLSEREEDKEVGGEVDG